MIAVGRPRTPYTPLKRALSDQSSILSLTHPFQRVPDVQSSPRFALTLIAAGLVIQAAACEKQPSPSRQSTGESSSQSASTPAAPAASAPSYDWASVTAANASAAIAASKNIARQCDGWHKGQVSVIKLVHNGTQVSDGKGNTLAVAAADWKGIVELARKPGEPYKVTASKSAMYTDSFGTIPRYMYEVKATDDSTLVFTITRKYDDGV